MPHVYDFSNCIGEVMTVEVNPKGWRGPLIIEYGIAQHEKYDIAKKRQLYMVKLP